MSDIYEIMNPILKKDPRYTLQAYMFVREGLDYTVHKLEKPRHVNGQELLEGMREFALKQFGPIAKRVLSEWGINECIDFGNIVFNLVNEGLLGKTEDDTIEDFMGGYDFSEAFIQPFRPSSPILKTTHQTVKFKKAP
ncbi:MAG TPA: Minf_1886 family protein [Pontiella sp.]